MPLGRCICGPVPIAGQVYSSEVLSRRHPQDARNRSDLCTEAASCSTCNPSSTAVWSSPESELYLPSCCSASDYTQPATLNGINDFVRSNRRVFSQHRGMLLTQPFSTHDLT